jgi:hypothetical protein
VVSSWAFSAPPQELPVPSLRINFVSDVIVIQTLNEAESQEAIDLLDNGLEFAFVKVATNSEDSTSD